MKELELLLSRVMNWLIEMLPCWTGVHVWNMVIDELSMEVKYFKSEEVDGSITTYTAILLKAVGLASMHPQLSVLLSLWNLFLEAMRSELKQYRPVACGTKRRESQGLVKKLEEHYKTTKNKMAHFFLVFEWADSWLSYFNRVAHYSRVLMTRNIAQLAETVSPNAEDQDVISLQLN